MQIYLVRHPEPRDASGRCYGRLDLAVEPLCVERTAHQVRARIPPPVLGAPIYTSPLSRCRALAQVLAAPRKPLIVEELQEMSFGSWEGRRWDALPPEALNAWAADLWHYAPGGDESPAMVAVRWLQWLGDLRRSGAGLAIAVTHAGVIRVALACAGLLDAAHWAQTPIEFGSVHRIAMADAE